ncbi:MAG TPA: hypothetical protein VFD58_14815 [Blastocatellia bacterium]|nr:hypothetical protein [Blastocatellia bacterium]
MVARQSVPVIGACSSSQSGTTSGGDSSTPGPGQWQLSIGYRSQRSARHFVGTVEQKQRQELGTAIVNNIHLFDVALSYTVTPRITLAVGVPIMYAKRKRPGALDLPRVQNSPDQIFHSVGIGDMSVGARMWLIRPPSESRQNIAFGVSFKLPTGKPDVTDTVMTANGPVTQVVDQSIQLGDGGTGVAFDVQAYKAVKFVTFFGAGTYLLNPRNTNGVKTGRGRASEAIMSVPDQYVARLGAAVPAPKIRGLSMSVAGRIEGVPVRDLIGKSEGFRRPGYAISVEPGLLYTRGRDTWSVSLPVAVERNRRRSVSDIADGRSGDAAFADTLLIIGYSRRF